MLGNSDCYSGLSSLLGIRCVVGRENMTSQWAAGNDFAELLERLEKSAFRSRFKLGSKERAYLKEKGFTVIQQHARDFIASRLAPAEIANDGKQTPMRGHPVFIAQHATATCCRKCLEKWHRLPQGRELTSEEVDLIVSILLIWLKRQAQAPARTELF